MFYNFTSICINRDLILFILFRNWSEFSAWRHLSFITCGNLVHISSNITSLLLSGLILELPLLYFNPKIQHPPIHNILMSKEIGRIWQLAVFYKSYQLGCYFWWQMLQLQSLKITARKTFKDHLRKEYASCLFSKNLPLIKLR